METDITEKPVETTLKIINSKWKVLLVHELLHGAKRFCELENSLKIVTRKVLTANLRALEEDGIVKRKIYNEVPPKVEYSLTFLGYSLKEMLDYMDMWGVEYKKISGKK